MSSFFSFPKQARRRTRERERVCRGCSPKTSSFYRYFFRPVRPQHFVGGVSQFLQQIITSLGLLSPSPRGEKLGKKPCQFLLSFYALSPSQGDQAKRQQKNQLKKTPILLGFYFLQKKNLGKVYVLWFWYWWWWWFWCSCLCFAYKLGPLLPRPLPQNKGGNKENESTSSLLSRRNQALGVGETIVFDGKMGMRKFGSAAPPFGKVACVVKGFQGRIVLPLF